MKQTKAPQLKSSKKPMPYVNDRDPQFHLDITKKNPFAIC